MKSYFIVNVDSVINVPTTLNELLPGQRSPWIIMHNDRACGIVNIDNDEDGDYISIDIPGSCYDSDLIIIGFAKSVIKIHGGEIIDDNNEVIAQQVDAPDPASPAR